MQQPKERLSESPCRIGLAFVSTRRPALTAACRAGRRPGMATGVDRGSSGVPVELLVMAAKSEAVIVDAGGRDLRVSSADRAIFPATERTQEITKLQIVEYY